MYSFSIIMSMFSVTDRQAKVSLYFIIVPGFGLRLTKSLKSNLNDPASADEVCHIYVFSCRAQSVVIVAHSSFGMRETWPA